ncbi:aminotransferase class I/II-fold pyridoxal phosphate-dependent enzyme [Candidatus Sulfidibacterium hydrothermale]|uniref:aminotransferase class I/II-fold pyridoxal phosphate-dependent enzyme n=1 Tax=Candidatus Sulfidibacterium hydrothermale TaxID=2875962 RepID=UPI001F0AA088|nr:aminotransferase class I/II-fold pyridoxal phosphate-dependent enzyme [Candidatus Sulfidibacterium hydrothermale]UBM62770.1 aminotransferase class I/II-fold pyridoxal phosphate-dependent enzyme [Candidatus Sulfidibacterium hydrothermale]
MSDLQNRAEKFTAPQKYKKLGVYPYFRMLESGQDAVVEMKGHKVSMFGSNNYLGLTSHPKVKEAAIAAIKKYGTGTAGSRFLNGTLDIHIELEHRLARFVHKEAALAFSTGFQSNLGAIPSVIGRYDVAVIDEQSHASIIDATRLSFGRILKYRHNDMESLEKVLRNLGENNNPDALRLIVTDGLFSMEGDIAKVDQIVRLAKKYGASVMIDDAHGLGVLGEKGSGTVNHFGLDDDVEMIVGTFSKSLASIGGFIAGSKELINYLQHTARSLIFSASLPPASAASVLAALDVIEEDDELVHRLWENTHHAQNHFKELGMDVGNTETPIIPVYVRDNDKAFLLSKMLLDDGVFINPVISPAVRPEDSLLRFALMATHTLPQIDEAIDKIYAAGKKVGIYH